jgi:hypothetical protein
MRRPPSILLAGLLARLLSGLLPGLLGVLIAAPAHAQSLQPLQPLPLSGEILISVSDTSSRLRPDVAADRAGRFMVVWREITGQDGGIAGRRLGVSGVPSSPGFAIEPQGDGLHTTDPRIVARTGGGFLVAWGEAAFLRPGCARARAFAADGQDLTAGDAFDLGPCATENGRAPNVALAGLPDGRFTAAWETGQAMSSNGFDIVVRPFASADEPLSDPLRVDEPVDGGGRISDQTAPALALDADGRAFALWHENSSAALIGRGFDTAGQPLGAPFRIDSGPGFPVQAAVASSLSGRFVAVWSAFTDQGTRIFAQLFDSVGRKHGRPVPVSPPDALSHSPRDPRDPRDPDVAMDATGNFVVVWSADRVDGAGTGVLGRLFDRDGISQGEPFRINVTGPGSQGHPAVAFSRNDRNDRFLVVWDSQKDANARGSIVARLYFLFRPVVP